MSGANGELRAPLVRFTGAGAGRGEADVRRRCADDVRLVADVARVDGNLSNPLNVAVTRCRHKLPDLKGNVMASLGEASGHSRCESPYRYPALASRLQVPSDVSRRLIGERS